MHASSVRTPGFFSTSGSSTGMLVSVILHATLLLLIIIGWHPEREPRKISTPKYIEAELLQMDPGVNEPVAPKVDEDAKRREEEKKRQQEEQRRQEQLKKEQEAEAERKQETERKKQEQLKQEQLKKEQLKQEEEAKEQAEKKRQEDLQKERERQEAQKREAEKKRQEELRRQQQEQDLAKALAQEEAAMQAEEGLKQIGTYKGYMAGLIAANWSRPPSARRDMQVELEILLGAAGRVTGVRVLKSSGNAAFDRSAEQAVFKVGQFTRLKEMDPALYQREFRRVILIFRPEDLRM